MITSLRESWITDEYGDVLTTLEKGQFWGKEWAKRQYVGLVVTAMCLAVVKNEHEARRYAVLRVLEVFLEHLHDLLPANTEDFALGRTRVATLAIPSLEEQCSPWVDILEYLQLMNWTRKGIYSNHGRAAELRRTIEKRFSSELLAEIDEGAEGWWIS